MSLYGKLCIDKKVSEKEEKNNISKWVHIPDELLELIMKRLCLMDYLALRTICTPWRSTVTKAMANKHCCPLSELPLIVLLSDEEVLFSLRTEREHCPKVSIFESRKITCYGSVEGWMIMCDYVKKNSLSIFFKNPVTNSRVSISSPLDYPSNSPIQGKKLCLSKMVASSGPDCYKSNDFLAALFNDFLHIAFYSLFDKSWNMIKPDQDSGVAFLDIEIMGSKLYVRTSKPLNSIIVYDLKDFSSGSSPKTKVLAMLPQRSTPHVPRIIDNQHHVSGCAFCSLAKHETLDQLFLIYMICNITYRSADVGYLNMPKEYVIPPEITGVEVFKIDINKEPIKWIKCERLDDDVIFVSGVKSMVMSRTSLNCPQALIRENNVYFALSFKCPSDPWQGNLLGIKHLTDSSIKYFSIEKSNHSKVLYPFWFIPSI
ncbi:uncharacterized protein LOC130712692 [Lotus japonicus]|uniref:uncharacterized protein LOC130712692 n=1 Tax=Lotus japonicus TaxID=34305 RepID=UPI00258D216C|nr:uncharacterized protein LOC130712692 [Lotus japonicus]